MENDLNYLYAKIVQRLETKKNRINIKWLYFLSLYSIRDFINTIEIRSPSAFDSGGWNFRSN